MPSRTCSAAAPFMTAPMRVSSCQVPWPGVDHERGAAEPRHARLERGERAQRRIEEQQAENLSGERLRLRLLRQPVARASSSVEDLARAARSARSRKRFMRRCRQRGAQQVDVLLLEDERRQQAQDRSDRALVPARMPLPAAPPGCPSPAGSCAGRQEARPWKPVDRTDDAGLADVGRTRAARCASRSSVSIASMTASTTAQAIGPPPNVVPRIELERRR